MYMAYSFFFFQAEDGIRDLIVTGVQTCALPISRPLRLPRPPARRGHPARAGGRGRRSGRGGLRGLPDLTVHHVPDEIGRASCRGRGEISVVAVSLKRKKILGRGGGQGAQTRLGM